MSRQPPRSTLFPYPTLVRAAAIPASAASLAEDSREALEAAVSETVERQMAELSAVSERAIETARRASDWKSTRLNSSHANISYAVFCLKQNHTPEYARAFIR